MKINFLRQTGKVTREMELTTQGIEEDLFVKQQKKRAREVQRQLVKKLQDLPKFDERTVRAEHQAYVREWRRVNESTKYPRKITLTEYTTLKGKENVQKQATIQVAKATYQASRQRRDEGNQNFTARKLNLYRKAYPPEDRKFSTFAEDTWQGLYDKITKWPEITSEEENNMPRPKEKYSQCHNSGYLLTRRQLKEEIRPLWNKEEGEERQWETHHQEKKETLRSDDHKTRKNSGRSNTESLYSHEVSERQQAQLVKNRNGNCHRTSNARGKRSTERRRSH